MFQALDYIDNQKGNGSVRCLVDYVGVNYKWIERSFQKNTGIPSKEYIQPQRFKHAYFDLFRNEKINFLDIALSNGYYDTNHFMKDFKRYSGKTPHAYLNIYPEKVKLFGLER